MVTDISYTKCTPIFLVNLTNYTELWAEISSILHGDLNISGKYNKINV